MTDYGPDGKYGKVCSVPACGRDTKTYGWCAKHYLFWLRGGRVTREGHELVKPEPYIHPKEFKCRINGCETNATGSKGLCKTHYTTLIRHGDPEYKRPSIAELLWSTTNKKGPKPELRPELGRCWLSTRPVNSSGYVTVSHKLGHRLSYELANGPIPEDLVIDHLCLRRHCVRPKHLEAVTQSENMKRTWSKYGKRRK